jgi:hypothetical protein
MLLKSEYRNFLNVVNKAKEACKNEKFGGKIPENLPATYSIKKLESKQRKLKP